MGFGGGAQLWVGGGGLEGDVNRKEEWKKRKYSINVAEHIVPW